MKKILLLIFLAALLVGCSQQAEAAGRIQIVDVAIRDLTTNSVITSFSDLSANSNIYIKNTEVWRSGAVEIGDNAGDLGVAINLSASSDIDVDWVYSIDGTTWYTPKDDDNATIDCSIDTLTENSFIKIDTPIQANFIRFDLDADGDSGLNGAWVIKQIER